MHDADEDPTVAMPAKAGGEPEGTMETTRGQDEAAWTARTVNRAPTSDAP